MLKFTLAHLVLWRVGPLTLLGRWSCSVLVIADSSAEAFATVESRRRAVRRLRSSLGSIVGVSRPTCHYCIFGTFTLCYQALWRARVRCRKPLAGSWVHVHERVAWGFVRIDPGMGQVLLSRKARWDDRATKNKSFAAEIITILLVIVVVVRRESESTSLEAIARMHTHRSACSPQDAMRFPGRSCN